MSSIGNSPQQHTVLRLEARKSFVLGVLITNPHGRPADLEGCKLTIVAKPPNAVAQDDDANLLAQDAEAILVAPELGYARFELQAATLDHEPGEYPFAIVLVTDSGYSSVLVKGTLDLQQNTEVSSVGHYFSAGLDSQRIDVVLQGRNVVHVSLGAQPPPGWRWLRDDIAETIESFDPDGVAMVPPGGLGGYVLTKVTGSDYAMAWRPVGNGVFALNAYDQPAGFAPVARGDGTWDWASPELDATDASAGTVPVADGEGDWTWAEPTSSEQADWDAPESEPTAILNKPELGTAAASDVEDFVAAGTLVSEMAGVHIVTSVPSQGEDGHLYFVYDPNSPG